MGRMRSTSEYESLAEVRYQIRRFLHFSEQAARDAGVEPQQHQLMLALKGLPEGTRPRVGELAERLQIKPHSAVELINRLAAAGYVHRHPADEDRREVLIGLTAKGEKILRELSLHHRAELRKRGPLLIDALTRAMATRQARVSRLGEGALEGGKTRKKKSETRREHVQP